MPVLSQITAKYPLQEIPLMNIRVEADGGPEHIFCQLLVDFGHRCSQLGSSDAWQELLKRLRWAALLVRCVPLSSSDNILFDKGLQETVRTLNEGTIDEELSELSDKITIVFEQLSTQLVSPLMTELGNHLRAVTGTVRLAVLAYDRRLIPAIAEALKKEKVPDYVTIEIGDWATLSRKPVFDEICVFGSVRNLPEGIYKSGQGKAYTRFAYAWTRHDPAPKQWFETYTDYEDSIWDSCRFIITTIGDAWNNVQDALVPVEAPLELEVADNAGLLDGLLSHASNDDDWLEAFMVATEERVRARPIYLTGNLVLHLGPSLREDVFVLQTESLDVQEIPVMDLRPGDCLVVPEAANRDYRSKLIDQKLGKARVDCRKRQAEWKQGLAAAIEQNGLPATITKLQEMGCKRANVVNLYNWAYGSVVCPQRNADFMAIMSHLGYAQQYSLESHKLLKLILSASHQVSDIMLVEMRKAFAHLDGRVLAQLDNSPLTLTLTSGELRFRLMRVTGLGPIVEVPRSAYENITSR
jgi:hypothetical protein